jgi:hypothetical protein
MLSPGRVVHGVRAPRVGAGRFNDEGSIAVAMTVMMLLSVLSVAILARTLVSLHQVRRGQDFLAALATADGGLSDALFRIDQSTPPTITGSGAVGAGSFSYVATRQAEDRYLVQVKGIVNNSAHAVEATVSRKQRFPYALFSNQGITLNGNGKQEIYSFAVPGGVKTGKARIGSNRAIVINSGKGGGDFQDFYAPAGSCSGCPTPTPLESQYELEPIVVPISGTQSCPALGSFTGAINGMGGVPIVCDQNVTFSGNVSVINPPAVIYVTADHSLHMADSILNAGGRAKDLMIFKAGGGTLEPGNGSHAVAMTGVLYAPESEITVSGGATFYGSITVNSVRVNGAPNFTLGYDESLASVFTQNWRVLHWQEVPSTSLGF